MTFRACKALLRGLLLLAAVSPVIPVSPAQANIESVTVTPANVQVAVPKGSTITVTWRVTRRTAGTPPIVTVSSDRGRFEIGGTLIETNPVTLSQINDGTGVAISTEVFTETLRVPSNVAFQMAQNPNLPVTYSRTFSDTGTARAGSVRLVPSTGNSAGLDYRRLDLFFEDKSRVKVLPSNDRLVALAELNFDGSGIAQFEWQIAEPSSTRGALVFRRLQVFRRSLAGRGRVILQSPELPTASQGLHVVRLVAVDPAFDFTPPEIKYFVVPRKDSTVAPAGQQIVVSGPAAGAVLTPETEFSWQKTPGAAVYQLEVYALRPNTPVPAGRTQPIGGQLLIDPDELSTRPITGIVLPSDRNSTSLQIYSLNRLKAGQTYLWRLKAISGNGTVIGTSPVRRIVVAR